MDHLGPLCLLAILMLHCVYAEYYPESDTQIVLFNPSNGRVMDPMLFSPIRLRSLRQALWPINDNVVKLPSLGMPCSCQDYRCQCCLGTYFGGGNQTTCVKIQYDWRVFGVQFRIEWNDQLLASFGLSARNVPDFCTTLVLPIPLFTCLRISNIEILEVDNSFHFCTSLVLKGIFTQIFEYKFSCMRLGRRGLYIEGDMDMDMVTSESQLDRLVSQSTNDKLQIYNGEVQ